MCSAFFAVAFRLHLGFCSARFFVVRLIDREPYVRRYVMFMYMYEHVHTKQQHIDILS